MEILKKKYMVKIPGKIYFFYCKKKKIIIIKGPATQKSFKIETKIKIKSNRIVITSLFLNKKVTNNLQKKLKSNQGTITAIIKQFIVDTSNIGYKKLNFIGVGYRAFFIKNNILLFKLGYSHSIYFNIPVNFEIFCLKLTKLFINGKSNENLSKIAAIIRSKKLPEPYKGKGILYENEKVKIKEGKKI